MSKPTEVILLCEDYRQSSLVLAYLKKCGIHQRVRPLLSPMGEGSAEHWVIRQYPIQVNAYRLAKARKLTWLIVVVDADTGTVDRRIAQLDDGLKQSEEPRLRELNVDKEAIGRLVPRRNIETWILALTGVTVSETENYKHMRTPKDWAMLVPAASMKLYDLTRVNARLPKSLSDSLHRGIRELNSIEQKAR
jgi:hypothetical protein